MTVAELIAALQEMPQEAEAQFWYDSAARSVVGCVWLARSGAVVMADDDEERELARRNNDQDSPIE